MAGKWDDIYSRQAMQEPQPCWTLEKHAHLLPPHGQALDLACGLGGNARFLAQRGLDTLAWDLSQVAVNILNKASLDKNWPLVAELRDVEASPPEPESFDVIVVSNFLHRASLPALRYALRKNGILFYQTHTLERPAGVSGPSNPDFLLKANELLDVFGDMRILAYRDDGLLGDLSEGRRGVASLVACK